MNKIFRVIWSNVLQGYVVVSECARGKVKASTQKKGSHIALNSVFAATCVAMFISAALHPAAAATGTVIADGVSKTVTDEDVVATGNRADVGQNAMGLSAGNGGLINFSGGSITTSGTGGLGAISNNNSAIVLSDTSISTSGASAVGLISQNNSTITGSNINISTTNSQSHGAQAIDGSLTLTDSTIKTTGASSQGVATNNANGMLQLNNSSVTTSGANAYALYAAGGGQATVNNSSIVSEGNKAYGIWARGKGTVVNLDDSVVSTTGSSSEAIMANDGSVINVNHSTVNTSGINGYALRAYGAGSVVDFKDGTLNTSGASGSVQAYGAGSEVRVRNATINTARDAIYSTYGKVTAQNVIINNTGAAATANNPAIGIVSAYSTGLTSAQNVQINSTGAGIEGVRAWGGAEVDLQDVELNHSVNGVALVTTKVGKIKGDNVRVNINSLDTLDKSAGIWMGRAAGDNEVELSNSRFILNGANDAGLISESDDLVNNTLTLTDSAVSVNDGTAILVYGNAHTVVNASGTALTGTTLLSAGAGNAGTVSNIEINGDNNSVLVGDVVVDRANTDKNIINLDHGSVWKGATKSLETLNLSNGSQWNVSADSAVDGLTLKNSTLNLGSQSIFNRVTLGNMLSEDSQINFRTALAGDQSQTDYLHITGDYSGNSNVSVQNAGGHGAATLNGIELIRVDGKVDGTFTQQGRIVAGAYDYNLVRNANAWLLKSEVNDAGGSAGPGGSEGGDNGDGQEGSAGGELPVKSTPVTRPEAASYTANLAAANNLFTTTLHDRLGETHYIDSEGRQQVSSLWMRNAGGHSRFGDSSGQLKTTANRYVIQLGGDVAQWNANENDRFHLGVMGGYARSNSSTVSGVTGHGSKGEISGYSTGLYATWLQNNADKTGAYVDSWMLYNWFDNNVKGDDIAAESYKSRGVTASAEAGYTFKIADLSQRESVYLQPKAQVIYMGVKSDDHKEANGTDIKGEGNSNVQSRVGVRAFLKGHSMQDDNKGRIFEPFIEANWIHNTETFGTRMNDVSIQQAGSKNIGEVKVGVESKLSKTVNLWGNIGQQVGGQSYSDTSAMVGLKINF